jgi:8-oxo-dGTP pyrophosphatase MutT (NUDIX family)
MAAGPADGGKADEGSPGSQVPGWLSRLVAAAGRMEIPARLRPPATGGRTAAVLILFGTGASGPDLLLIERSAGLRDHPGQPALPGGSIDGTDAGPVAAALREAAEETGVDPAGVQVLGVMPELYIDRSGFRVTPVIGWWRTPGPVAPGDTAEIAAVHRVPLADLASPANRIMIRYPNGLGGPAFRVCGLVVWGFTAMLLDRVLALAGWEQPWNSGLLTELAADERPFGWPRSPS